MNDALTTLGGLSMVNPPAIDLDKPQGLWLSSDWHVGASNTDHKRIESDIRRAVRRRDRVLVNGDVWDAIIAGDLRYQGTTLHPRLLGEGEGDDYPLDAAIDWAAEILDPAVSAGLCDYLGHGNHETAIQKRSGVNMLEALRHRFGPFRDQCPKPAGYCGFINYKLRYAGKTVGRYVIFAHHGNKAGRGRGLLEKLSSIADADLTWIGHFHNKDSSGKYTVGPSACGRRVEVRERRQVMTGGYSFAYGANKPGRVVDRYASVSALTPGLLGGSRVVLSWEDGALRVEVQS